MAATFVIFLREGIEASMIVAILLAALDRMGRRDQFREVIGGVIAALLVVAAGGVGIYLTIKAYDGSRMQTVFETVTYLLAAVVLTYMTFWMRGHARTLSAELRAKAEAALDGRAKWGLRLLAFQAVGREGLETMVFTLAIVFASNSHGVMIGGGAGVVVSLGIAFAVYHLGKRINIALFFKTLGAVLIVFAAGILVDAVENMQQLGWINILTHPMWQSGRLLSEDSAVGDIFHSFFGYSQSPTVLMGIVYLMYIVIAVGAFIGLKPGRLSPSRLPSRTAGTGRAGASPAPGGLR